MYMGVSSLHQIQVNNKLQSGSPIINEQYTTIHVYHYTIHLFYLHQFVRRLLLLLMPAKYQPDYEYLRKVPTRRVHMYTVIQFISFIALWIVKKIQIVSITFPLMVCIKTDREKTNIPV